MPTSAFLALDYVEGAVSKDLVVALTPDPAAPNNFRAVFDIRLAGLGGKAEAA